MMKITVALHNFAKARAKKKRDLVNARNFTVMEPAAERARNVSECDLPCRGTISQRFGTCLLQVWSWTVRSFNRVW